MKIRLSQLNNLLLVAIILVNGYVVAVPFIPSLLFWATSQTPTRQRLEARATPSAAASDDQPEPPSEDRLLIPSMLLDQQIFTGTSAKTLNRGLWLRPHSSTPEKGGNTVIVGHRFTYTNPRGSLYHLNKVAVDDKLAATWRGKTYYYKVREVKVVPADATFIEKQTATPQLTIYTCTPLWLPTDRLVVIADEVSHD